MDRLPVLHEIVIAPYNSEFYRARVTSVHPETATCKLTFFDFGNKATCQLSDIRELDPSLTEVRLWSINKILIPVKMLNAKTCLLSNFFKKF